MSTASPPRDPVLELILARVGEKRLGKCEIIERVGVGAMGSVYRAWHNMLEVEVALKVLAPEFVEHEQEVRKRFLQEGRVAARLNHRNIVRVLDVDVEQDFYFLVMEYVDGPSALQRLKDRGPFPEEDALTIGVAMADALNTAHKQNIIHRDVKPANILIASDGCVKLSDLGLAKQLQPDPTSAFTQYGLGTPAYMAPEQAQDAAKVDGRADIYALGTSLFHLATGRFPFSGESPIEVVVQHLNLPVPDLRKWRPDYSSATCALVRRMMAKKPEERPSSMEEVLRSFRQAYQDLPEDRKRGPESAVALRPAAAGDRPAAPAEKAPPAPPSESVKTEPRPAPGRRQRVEPQPDREEPKGPGATRPRLQFAQPTREAPPAAVSAVQDQVPPDLTQLSPAERKPHLIRCAKEMMEKRHWQAALSCWVRVLEIDPQAREAEEQRKKCEKLRQTFESTKKQALGALDQGRLSQAEILLQAALEVGALDSELDAAQREAQRNRELIAVLEQGLAEAIKAQDEETAQQMAEAILEVDNAHEQARTVRRGIRKAPLAATSPVAPEQAPQAPPPEVVSPAPLAEVSSPAPLAPPPPPPPPPATTARTPAAQKGKRHAQADMIAKALEQGDLVAASKALIKLEQDAAEAEPALVRRLRARLESIYGQALGRVIAEIRAQKFAEARVGLARAATIHPDSPEVAKLREELEQAERKAHTRDLVQQGEQALSAKDFAAALAAFRQAHELFPAEALRQKIAECEKHLRAWSPRWKFWAR